MPDPVGAASFARALYAFGFAARLAAAPAALPFAIAREPAFVAAHRFAFVLGALPTDVEFHVRGLRLGKRQALAQARTLARTALFEARIQAARILLGDDASFAPKDLFAEMGARLFGAPLDPRFRGAWPGARDDEPARLLALLQAQGMGNALREAFDADWFRNPRAWRHLRAQGVAAREPVAEDALEASVSSLARAFEEALG